MTTRRSRSARHDRLHLGMIDAEHRGAIERHVLDELDEGVLDRVEAAVMVEMLGIDVGDDRDRAVEPQEAAVALVGLDHHPVAVAEPGVGAVALMMPPLITVGSIPPASSSAAIIEVVVVLPCVPATATVRLQPHQLGQHLGAADHRDAALVAPPRPRDCPLDRGRDHHHRGLAEIVGVVADRDLDARARAAPRRHSLRRRPSPAPCSRGCASPRRCPTCRCRRCRRNGSCRYRCRRPSCRHPVRHRLKHVRRARTADRRPGRRADPLDQVGEVACRIGPAARLRPRARHWPALRARAPASASAWRARPAVKLGWRIARAPPALTISRALAVWWSSVAIGSGTRIAGRPTAVSSAMVEAPARRDDEVRPGRAARAGPADRWRDRPECRAPA